MLISKSFDSGSIDVIDATNPADVRLSILRDHASEWYQWFHFRVSGVKDDRRRPTWPKGGKAA